MSTTRPQHQALTWWIRLAPLTVLVGCAYGLQLTPAPNASSVEGMDHAAVAEAAGVTVVARGQSWSARPVDLDDYVTPLWVRIENRSDRAFRLSLKDLSLVSDGGFAYAALSPFLRPSDEEHVLGAPPAAQQTVVYQRAYVTPVYRWVYAGVPLWDYDLPFDPCYYDTMNMWPTQLPTVDMVQRALPGGVIHPGGHIEGFVYFQRLPDDTKAARFIFRLVDSEDGEALGKVEIPFVVGG